MPIAKTNDMQQTLSFDDLESRVMLAGNVEVALVGDDLVITGDVDDNEFQVNAFDDDIVRVTGLNGTFINGEFEGTAEFEIDDLNDLVINTDLGNDVVLIQNAAGEELELEGGLIYDGGGFELALFGQAGDTLTVGSSIDAEGDSSITGSDAVSLFGTGDQITLNGGEYDDGLSIASGLGRDTVSISNVEVDDGVVTLDGGGLGGIFPIFFEDALDLSGNDFEDGADVVGFEIV